MSPLVQMYAGVLKVFMFLAFEYTGVQLGHDHV